MGRKMGLAALERGQPLLVDPGDLPPAATIITVSMVGSPASPDAFLLPEDFSRAVRLLEAHGDIRVGAVITNENGALATVNGWVQSADLGIPVLDVPCNGRAHPTSAMGSLGLHRDSSYRSIQAAVGGNRDHNQYLEVVISGNLDSCSRAVRQSSVSAGGLVAVARNPVSLAQAVSGGAPGAIRQAIELGQAMMAAQGGRGKIDAICSYLGGDIIVQGQVTEVHLETGGGFDRGQVVVAANSETCHLWFLNEYMKAAIGEINRAQFPDLIATLDASSGLPIATSHVTVGQEVAVLVVPRDNLILSTTMDDRGLLSAAMAHLTC